MLKNLGIKNLNILSFLFYLSLFTLSLGQFSNIYKRAGANIYLFDIFVLLFCIYGILKFNFNLIIPKKFYGFLIFTYFLILSNILFFNNYVLNEYIVGLFYLIRLIAYLFSTIIIYNMIKNNLINIQTVINCFILSGVFISIAGFIQLLVLPDLSVLDSSLNWDPHKNRLVSVFFDPNFTGSYLSILTAVMFYKYFYSKKFAKKDYFILFLFLLAILLTFSRSAWLFLSIIVLIFTYKKSKLYLLLFIFMGFLIYFAVPRIQTRISGVTDPSDSAHFRLISWKNTIDIIKDNWLLGVGYNNFRYAQQEYGIINDDNYLNHNTAGSDSSFLLLFATIGIIGFTIFLLLYLNFIVTENILVKSILIGLFFNSMFINSLLFPIILFTWPILLINRFSFDK